MGSSGQAPFSLWCSSDEEVSRGGLCCPPPPDGLGSGEQGPCPLCDALRLGAARRRPPLPSFQTASWGQATSLPCCVLKLGGPVSPPLVLYTWTPKSGARLLPPLSRPESLKKPRVFSSAKQGPVSSPWSQIKWVPRASGLCHWGPLCPPPRPEPPPPAPGPKGDWLAPSWVRAEGPALFLNLSPARAS